MNIIQVSAGWTETCSLPEYNNIKPSVTLTATLEAGDDPQRCVEVLLEKSRAQVYEMINQAQDRVGVTPKYWDGPLYRPLKSYDRRAYIVVPVGGDFPADFSTMGFDQSGRLEAVLKRAEGWAKQMRWPVFDCSDGRFDKLPPLPASSNMADDAPPPVDDVPYETEDEESF
jgi:hypothetical protein